MAEKKSTTPPSAAPAQSPKVHLKYESMTALFADHVVLTGTNGGVILDFASALVSDPGSGDSTIPIHSRIAMTHGGAAQLFRLLSGVFQPSTPPQTESTEPSAG